MERSRIISELKSYFAIKELVCPHVLAKWGEASWQFLDTDLLECLLIVRRNIIVRPMIVNSGSGYTQRGLRCNMCDVVRNKSSVYVSAHVLGKGVDFTVSGMSASEARERIKRYAYMLPCNVRLEKDVSWVHMDVLPQWNVNQKVYEFKG